MNDFYSQEIEMNQFKHRVENADRQRVVDAVREKNILIKDAIDENQPKRRKSEPSNE